MGQEFNFIFIVYKVTKETVLSSDTRFCCRLSSCDVVIISFHISFDFQLYSWWDMDCNPVHSPLYFTFLFIPSRPQSHFFHNLPIFHVLRLFLQVKVFQSAARHTAEMFQHLNFDIRYSNTSVYGPQSVSLKISRRAKTFKAKMILFFPRSLTRGKLGYRGQKISPKTYKFDPNTTQNSD